MEHKQAENDWRCICGECHVCGQEFGRPYRSRSNVTVKEGCVCTCHEGMTTDAWHATGKSIRRRQALAFKDWGNKGVICNA